MCDATSLIHNHKLFFFSFSLSYSTRQDLANEVIMFAQEALSLRCDLAIIGHINKAIKRNSFQPNLNRGVECISQFLERVLSVEKRNSFKAHDDACKWNQGEKQRTVTILFTLVPKKKIGNTELDISSS